MTTQRSVSGRKVRWGIIGLGNIARHALVPAFRKAGNAELVAVASRDKARAGQLARELEVPVGHGSYEELLRDDRVDAVYIGLPNGLHEEWCVACATAGKHVLCEKSLTYTAESARRIRHECDRAGVWLQEAFMYRHHPQWDAVRRVLAGGKLGRIVSIHAMLSGNLEQSNPADHRWSMELGRGALYDVTCYGINVSRYILGAEPVAVQARADLGTPERVDRTSSVIMEFPGAVLATASGSLAAHHNQFARIVGSRGTLEIPKPFIPGHDPTTMVLRVEGVVDEVVSGPGADHFQRQVESFSACVRGESPSLGVGEDGLANVSACEAAVRAWESGETVKL